MDLQEKNDKLNKILNNNALFQLSLANSELFHSNFIYWLAESCPDVFNHVLKTWNVVKFTYDPNEHEVFREEKHLDFCIREKETEKILLVLENKFKSIPYQAQLKQYEDKVSNYPEKLENVVFILLTLTEPNFDTKPWEPINYQEFAESLTKFPSTGNVVYDTIITTYKEYIETFSKIVYDNLKNVDLKKDRWSETLRNGPFTSPRIKNLWQKIVVNYLAVKLRIKIEDAFKICNPFLNIVFNESTKELLDTKNDYKDYTIDIEAAFSHSAGALSVKIKLGDFLFTVQVQSNQYRRCIEVEKGSKEKHINAKNIIDEMFFDKSGNCDRAFLKNRTKSNTKSFNQFGEGFCYQYVKIDDGDTVEDVLNAMVRDMKIAFEIYRKQK